MRTAAGADRCRHARGRIIYAYLAIHILPAVMTQMPSIPLPVSPARPALTRALQALLALGPEDDRPAARVLAGLIAETDACAGLLRWPAQSGPCELLQGELPDEEQREYLE